MKQAVDRIKHRMNKACTRSNSIAACISEDAAIFWKSGWIRAYQKTLHVHKGGLK